ncbi:MAG TPA: xanthine dehydrogenase family protein molybdopterin-binding subunit [Nitrolancea sp.]|nr:xanthine dehydrogenase family protein molybdopterin-binding subunit [Nitrolancea sp.]
MTATSIIGQALPRLDSAEKVRGQTRYTADIHLPGMLYARFVTSYQAHARITDIDTSAARAVEGVVDVVSGRDLMPDGPEPDMRARAMLARDRVLFYGQPVVAVLAASEAAAEEAAGLVEVRYEPLGVNVDPIAAMRPDAPPIRAQEPGAESAEAGMHATVTGGEHVSTYGLGPNVINALAFRRGNVEHGFNEADVVVERTYKTHFVHQGYIEPHASVAVPDPLGRVTVYTATQGQFYARNTTADVLGIDQTEVTLVPMEVGGGFGGKTVLLEPLAAALALRVGRPVKIVLTRMEEFLHATPAPGSVIEIKTGAKKDGTITAIQARAVFDSGCYGGAPVNVALMAIGGYYRCANLDLEGYEVITNKPGVGAYRAPGAPQATFVIEQQVDEMARQLGWDPLEFRLHSCSLEGDPQANDTPWPPLAMKQILETMRDHPLLKQKPTGKNEGVGYAIGGWPGGVEPCAANLRVNTDGTLTLQLGSVDISGTNTVMAMIAAEVFKMPLEKVKIVTADTGTAPYTGMSGGSKITYTVGNAVRAAAQDARNQVLAIAATELEAAPDDLELENGKVWVKGSPDRSMPLGRVAHLSMTFGGKYEPVYGIGKSAVQDRAPGFSGQIAHVRVDPDTGEVEMLKLVVVQDVGTALNPALIRGQMMGGATQGVGWALHEGMIYDDNGIPLNPSLMDYSLPQSNQVPELETILVEMASKAGPYGAKGVGEPPVIPTAAAIANAVADASGARVTTLPITSQRVSEALQQKG